MQEKQNILQRKPNKLNNKFFWVLRNILITKDGLKNNETNQATLLNIQNQNIETECLFKGLLIEWPGILFDHPNNRRVYIEGAFNQYVGRPY